MGDSMLPLRNGSRVTVTFCDALYTDGDHHPPPVNYPANVQSHTSSAPAFVPPFDVPYLSGPEEPYPGQRYPTSFEFSAVPDAGMRCSAYPGRYSQNSTSNNSLPPGSDDGNDISILSDTGGSALTVHSSGHLTSAGCSKVPDAYSVYAGQYGQNFSNINSLPPASNVGNDMSGTGGSVPVAPVHQHPIVIQIPERPTDVSDVPQSVVGSESMYNASIARRKKEGKFLCDFNGCNRTFTARHNRKYHTNVHMKLSPYHCDHRDRGCTVKKPARTTAKNHSKICPFRPI